MVVLCGNWTAGCKVRPGSLRFDEMGHSQRLQLQAYDMAMQDFRIYLRTMKAPNRKNG